jgi:putative membrane protein
MVLDATLAYLHFVSIFALFAFLTTQAFVLRNPLAPAGVRLLGRIDLWFFGASMAVLITGFMRLGLGAKGADFYLSSWPIYVKVGLFLAVGIISITPTLRFIRWKRAVESDPTWKVPPEEQAKMRRLVMLELHLAALIPIFAVMMARGLGR